MSEPKFFGQFLKICHIERERSLLFVQQMRQIGCVTLLNGAELGTSTDADQFCYFLILLDMNGKIIQNIIF